MSSASSYKLVYFDLPGLAETARIMFRLAKQEFEDKRYPLKVVDGKFVRAEWDADKTQYVYERIPVLYHNGAAIPQSNAINRYVGKQLGFMGSNDIEFALIDAAMEQLGDVKKVWWTLRGKPAEEVREKFFQAELKPTFRLFSQQATKLKSAEGHLIGSKLSVIDILLYQLPQLVDDDVNGKELKALIKEFPVIQAIVDKTEKAAGPLTVFKF